VVAADGRGVVTMSRGSRVYLALYFNVERAEDLDLLTLLYALPLTRRGPAIKQILDAHLAAYLGAHHPDRSPLDRQAVRDLVAARARSGRRRRRAERADGGRRGAPSHPSVSIPNVRAPRTTGQGLEEFTDDAARAPSGNAEIRLDRLLRSFLR